MTGIALVAFGFGLLKGQELGTVDTRFSVRGTQPVPKEVATVLIDDATFDTVNDQWPFPWKLHAKVIRNLVRDGAKVIVYDVQFSELSRYGAADAQALGEAILKAGNVVLSSTATDAKGRPDVIFLLDAVHARAGYGNFPTDEDGAIRRVGYAPQGLKSLSIVAAERATGRPVESSQLGSSGTAWIDYRGP